MRLMVIVASSILLMLGAGASAATFWPAVGSAVSEREIAALVNSRRAALIGDRVVIDDMRFERRSLLLSGFTGARWPKGRLVYDVSSLAPDGQKAVADACALWAAASSVQCVKRTTEGGGYLKVTKTGGNVSSTDVGYPGGGRVSGMDLCCFGNVLHVAHELGHSLGLSHEHARSDRDTYVRIETADIKPGHVGQFAIRTTDNYGAYDFRSVMHYRADAFTANGKPSITVLPPNQAMQTVIGRATRISAIDGQGMSARYAAP